MYEGLHAIALTFGPALGQLVLMVVLVSHLFFAIGRQLQTPASGDAVPLSVAEEIARSSHRHATGLMLASAAGIATAILQSSSVVALLILVLATVPFGTLISSRGVLRELMTEHARAELCGTLLIVRNPLAHARVFATRRAIERAYDVPARIAR